MNAKEIRLGKGLAALLPEGADVGGRAARYVEVDVDFVRANPQQPRRHFDEKGLEELATSIREKGVVQPIIVRRVGGEYELIAGERRLRATKLAGLARIPVFIAEVDDGSEALELALIENLQREDLNPLEQAEGFLRLAQQYDLTQEQIAERVGKSRAAVANTLRLLKLPHDVQVSLRAGEITAGHARAILAFEDRERQVQLWRRISKDGLSVRQAEQIAKKLPPLHAPATIQKKRPPHLAQIEDRLRNVLGTHVRVHYRKGAGGTIEVQFCSDEDLERLLELFDQIAQD